MFNYIGACLDKEFVIRVSYLEIHNESVNDLLAPERINLRICEDRNRGVVVDNAKVATYTFFLFSFFFIEFLSLLLFISFN